MKPEKILAFRPDIVYVHTHWRNIRHFPPAGATAEQSADLLGNEFARYKNIWDSLHEIVGCQVIQNNFEHPPLAVLGSLDSVVPGGKTRFVYELNLAFANAAQANRKLLIQDLNALAAGIGHDRWFDPDRWFSYKILTTPEGSFAIAKSLAAMIGAMLGRVKKVLVLDLDNTLWGGVIGDDGIDQIQIGKETAVAEAFTAFQEYCLALHERGVLLAVCSKNDPDTAKSGFTHPDTVLKPEHFSSFLANWQPKPDSIERIARELNLGLDSFVFVDDNPAERAIVAAQLPMVTVPDVGSEVSRFPAILQAGRYFEAVSLSKEDMERTASYAANVERTAREGKYADYGEYLDSLKMSAEIESFESIYLERITQLINRTNQFNLTTRRYTSAEVEAIARDAGYLTLYGKLADTFGDNGLISVIIGRRENADLYLDLWIMSCRVLKRDMEIAMLDILVERARALGVERIVGTYLRTPKNAMVEDHYGDMGFSLLSSADDGSKSIWVLAVTGYPARTKHIQIKSQTKVCVTSGSSVNA